MDEHIREIRAGVITAQSELDAAIAACDHEFQILSQKHTILDQTICDQGWQGFVQQRVCKKCSHETKTKSVSPICIGCQSKLVIADKSDTVEQRAEFEATFGEKSRDIGSSWSGQVRAYRCLACGRAHTYGLEGD